MCRAYPSEGEASARALRPLGTPVVNAATEYWGSRCLTGQLWRSSGDRAALASADFPRGEANWVRCKVPHFDRPLAWAHPQELVERYRL